MQARGRATGRHPSVPHFVQVVHGADVGEPDGGAEKLGLVSAGLRQIAIDDRQDFRPLLGDAVGKRFVAVNPARYTGVTVYIDLAHASAGFDASNHLAKGVKPG
jgi:hypothetical protein